MEEFCINSYTMSQYYISTIQSIKKFVKFYLLSKSVMSSGPIFNGHVL